MGRPSRGGRSRRRQCLLSVRGDFGRSPLTCAALPSVSGPFFRRYQGRFKGVQGAIRRDFDTTRIGVGGARMRLRPSFLYRTLNVRNHVSLLAGSFDGLVRLGDNGTSRCPFQRPGRRRQLRVTLCGRVLCCGVRHTHRRMHSFLFCSHCPRFCTVGTPGDRVQRTVTLEGTVIRLRQELQGNRDQRILRRLARRGVGISKLGSHFCRRCLHPHVVRALLPLRGVRNVRTSCFRYFLAFVRQRRFLTGINSSHPSSSGKFTRA